MTRIFAKTALLSDGWVDNVIIDVDECGWVTSILENTTEKADKNVGILMPAMVNVHSHAFQRAMAGMAEYVTHKTDSFWTWRDLMYRFLHCLTPEDMSIIASQLYIEMLKAGYSHVGEFHYVHHDIGGNHYDDKTIMSQSVINAALDIGIGITHLPVLYMSSDFNQKPPTESQLRFVNQPDDLLAMITSLEKKYQNEEQVDFGLAYHSLRAVPFDVVCDVTKSIKKNMPIHIHISEQIAEVEGCINAIQKRPIEWLLENIDVNENWCLIHATHMNEAETQNLAKTKAVIGLCPTTEANLGDGLFPLASFLRQGGRIAIGSDSHISISVIEELRWLEYGQRLIHQNRSITRHSDTSSVGRALYQYNLQGGTQAVGRKTGQIKTGMRADFIVLDENHPSLMMKTKDRIIDSFIFAGNSSPITDVMAGGKWVVNQGRHDKETIIAQKYYDVLYKLLS